MSNKVEAAAHASREWRFLDDDNHWTKWLAEDHVATPGMGFFDVRLAPDGDYLEVQGGTRSWRQAPFSEGTFEVREAPGASDRTGIAYGLAAQSEAAVALRGTFGSVLTEIRRAVAKHGYSRTPLSKDPADAGKKLAVLVEEVGEVAHALNYDSANLDNLKDELVQVATMALAWRASLS
jgi:hypothetical protein